MPFNPANLFTCENCGQCCKGYGGTYITEKDIRAIADFTFEAPETFVSRYCSISCGKYLLTQSANGYCIFWDGRCQIHPVKPRMCKVWPFISGVLRDVKNWRIMAESCPGMRTDIPDHAITACVRAELKRRQ